MSIRVDNGFRFYRQHGDAPFVRIVQNYCDASNIPFEFHFSVARFRFVLSNQWKDNSML